MSRGEETHGIPRFPLWPALSVVGAIVVALVAASDVPFVRPVLVSTFLLFAPGFTLVRLLRLPERLTELILGVALSAALAAGLGIAMVYSGAWSPRTALAALLGITVMGATVDVATDRRRAARTPSTTTTQRLPKA